MLPISNVRIELLNDELRLYVSGKPWGTKYPLYAKKNLTDLSGAEQRAIECSKDLVCNRYEDHWRDIWYAHQHSIRRQIRRALNKAMENP